MREGEREGEREGGGGEGKERKEGKRILCCGWFGLACKTKPDSHNPHVCVCV